MKHWHEKLIATEKRLKVFLIEVNTQNMENIQNNSSKQWKSMEMEGKSVDQVSLAVTHQDTGLYSLSLFFGSLCRVDTAGAGSLHWIRFYFLCDIV